MPAMTNIAVTYATSQHGAGSDRATTKGWLKYPFTDAPPVPAPAEYLDGTTPYAALNCTTCHGPHGGENIYNLRSSITVAGVQMTTGGTNAFETFRGLTTYELPLGRNGTQENLGWGAWCSFCHDVNHDTRDGTGCQSSHLHGAGGNF
jgi:predicted CXXCH cytochrome family protein